jgi:diguanylate cyclase
MSHTQRPGNTSESAERQASAGGARAEIEPILPLLEHSTDGCVLTDDAGMVTYVNRALLAQTGLERDHVLEQSIRSLLTDRSSAFDPVTGLPRDAVLAERARPMLALARRHNRSIAVGRLSIDSGGNGENGPAQARLDPRVLQTVAARLRSTLRDTDVVGRLVEGSFALVLQEVEPDESLGRVANRVLDKLTEPIPLGGAEVTVAARMGMALFPRDASGWEELVGFAATALSRAHETRTPFAFYEPGFSTRTRNRMRLEKEFLEASDAAELLLHYQPVVTAEGGKVVGAEALARGQVMGIEALARWPHRDRGLVAPSEFIPIAEATGRILNLDRWAVATALRQASGWWAKGWEGWVSVNLSTRSVGDPELVPFVAGLLEEYSVQPDRLMLEITETTAMRDPEATIVILRKLKQLGVRIAIDDFGAGHSSLGYLRRMPVDLIKLDRIFLQNLGSEERDRWVVESIVALAHRLGAQIVAEGVEQPEDLEWLRGAGCDLVQGFLLGRPAPPEHMSAGLA